MQFLRRPIHLDDYPVAYHYEAIREGRRFHMVVPDMGNGCSDMARAPGLRISPRTTDSAAVTMRLPPRACT